MDIELIKKISNFIVDKISNNQNELYVINIFINNLDGNLNKSLKKIMLLEELTLQMKKKKITPLIEISTDVIKNRFFTELNVEEIQFIHNHLIERLNSINGFIDLGWNSNSLISNEIEPEKLEAYKNATLPLVEKINSLGIKSILVNILEDYELENANLNYEKLEKIYNNAILCKFEKIENNIKELNNYLKDNKCYFELLNKDNDKIEFTVEKVIIEKGDFPENNTLILPTGRIIFKSANFTGLINLDSVEIFNERFLNVKLRFRNGILRHVSCINNEILLNKILRMYIDNEKYILSFSLGINYEIPTLCGIDWLDINGKGNLFLILEENNFHDNYMWEKPLQILLKNYKILINDIDFFSEN